MTKEEECLQSNYRRILKETTEKSVRLMELSNYRDPTVIKNKVFALSNLTHLRVELLLLSLAKLFQL